MTLFPFTPVYAEKGLSSAEASAIAGIPILRFSLTEAVHWDKLALGQEFTEQDLAERTQGIWHLIKEAGLDRHGFTETVAGKIAQAGGAECFSVRHPVHILPDALTQHTSLPPHIRWSAPIDYRFSSSEADRITLPEASLPLGPQSHLKKDCPLFKATAAIILNTDISAKYFWASFAGLPASELKRFPEGDFHILSIDRHEAEHARQIQSDDPISIFYSELGCDQAAHQAMHEKGAGQDVHMAFAHGRYLKMLWTDSQYWFQPLLEDPDSLSFHEIFDAMMEIRCRLGMAGIGVPQDRYSNSELRDRISVWDKRPINPEHMAPESTNADPLGNEKINAYFIYGQTSKMPELLPDLQRLVDSGVFDKGSLSEKLAHRILDAAEYFSEGITGRKGLQVMIDVEFEEVPPQRRPSNVTHLRT